MNLRYDYEGAFRHHNPTERKVDGFGPAHPRPLLCNKCHVNVPREAYRLWGNPYCGLCYPRPLLLQELTLPMRFTRLR